MKIYPFTGCTSDRLNHSDEHVEFPLRVLWKSKIKKNDILMGNPVIGSDNIIISIPSPISNDKPSIINLDLESGMLLWEVELEESKYIQPYTCLQDDKVYAGSPLVAIRISDGDVVWKTDVIIGEGILPYKERLYTNGLNGLEARELKTGQVIWRDLSRSERGFAIYDDKIIFGDGPKGNIYCIHAIDGQLLWKQNVSKIGEYVDEIHSRVIGKKDVVSGWLSSAFPVISNGKFYCSLGRYMCCFNLDTGDLLWKSVGAGTPLYKDSKLYSYKGFDFFCYEADTGEILYRKHFSEEGSFQTSIPFIAGNAFFVGTEKGLYAFDINSGDKIWQYHSKRKIAEFLSQPVLINGRLYAGCSDGYLYCFEGAN